jgi:SNF2 family DNA or RNA helicase
MEEGQRAIYESVRLAMHTKVRLAIAEKGLARSGIIILDALLKLRQVCCDPRLLKLKAAREGKAGSAKLERLMEMLETMLEEGRRVLLFSQFTSMLALIEARLQAARIPYVVLTGDTTDRTTPVARFQAGEVPVFLISLKAGGVGLNLTAADTVIHYDPWWNPAVEDQATDRAYRIGQDKPVTVVRLIASGTIEEKMLSLKAKKRELTRAVIGDDARALEGLTEDDVRLLLGDADAADQDDDDESETGSPTDLLATAKSVLDPDFDALAVEVRWWLASSGRLAPDLATLADLPLPFAVSLSNGEPFPCSRAVADRIRARLRAW